MRRVGLGLLAGIAAGVLMGSVARLMMRLAALAADLERHISVEATAGIVVIFVIVTLPGAVVAAVSQRRARWVVLAGGALLLCLPAVGLATGDLADADGLSMAQWLGVAGSVIGVFAAILSLPLVTLRLIRVLSGDRTRRAVAPASA